MRLSSFLLGVALLSSSAFGGDLRIVGTGQVILVNPDPLTGALAGVVVGSPFQMTAEVFDTPSILGPGALTYPYDKSVGEVQVGPHTFTYDASMESLVVIDSAFAGDQISAPIGLDAPGQLSAGIAMTDVTGAALPTGDLAQLVGSVFTMGPETFIGGIDASNGSVTIVVQIFEIRIEAGGGSGGPGTGSYCAAANNSTGSAASISTSGSLVAADNDLTLNAANLPTNSFGFFITSQTQGFVMGPAGSQGNLCVGGGIGRYVGPGQIQNSGATGTFSLDLDLTQTPTPNGLVPVFAGDTWNFQAWFRDSVGGTTTSNFTDGYSVLFL